MTLTELLLTAEQQKQLSSLPVGSALTVTAKLTEHCIPWELVRVGDEFLGQRFAVGRVVSDIAVNTEMPAEFQLRTETETGGARFHRAGHVKNVPHVRKTTVLSAPVLIVAVAVLVAEAFELVSTNTERTIVERRLRQLSHDFPNLLHLTSMQAGPLTRIAFCQVIEESRWLHFAGHATEVVGQRVLNLHESPDHSAELSVVEQLTPTDLQDLCCAPEVVFLNACGALQLPLDENEIPRSSFVSEFLRLGTRWLLGPIVPVLDSQTRHFTAEFYDAILQGCSIGEAMRRARLAARRVLGPHNLLPMSYALYGDPSTSPFRVRTSMNSMNAGFGTLETLPMLNELEHDGCLGGRMGLHTRPEHDGTGVPSYEIATTKITFPCPCSSCGNLIETRHGIGNESAMSLGKPVVCVACHRNRDTSRPSASDAAREAAKPQNWSTSGDAPVASVAAAKTQLKKTVATSTAIQQQVVENPIFITFQRHLDECLNRLCDWKDIQTGKHRSCTFRRNEPKPMSEKRAGLNSLDAEKRRQESTWSADYTVIEQTGRGMADIRLLVPQFTENGSTTPVTIAALKPLLAAIATSNSQIPQVVFVCSLSGFDSLLLQELSADAVPLWCRPGRTVYLHDIGNNQTHFRSTDLAAYRLAHLLRRESTGRQFQQAVQWIEGQLPLVTSLGRDEIVRNLNIEIDAVEAAMRQVASLRQLQLDETRDLAWYCPNGIQRYAALCQSCSQPA